jgi:hypothetical protein
VRSIYLLTGLLVIGCSQQPKDKPAPADNGAAQIAALRHEVARLENRLNVLVGEVGVLTARSPRLPVILDEYMKEVASHIDHVARGYVRYGVPRGDGPRRIEYLPSFAKFYDKELAKAEARDATK